ncbi:DUF1294 domain-containing protein [Cohnella sp. CFH 77786]|nr:DUF1294 domain-containing protein [Cohnella sp. CFH 77786]
MNVTAYGLMAADKSKARRSGRRIRERTLLLAAAAGGALGAWIAMRTHRHKTKHAAFYAGIPLMLAVHAVAIVYWFSR